MRKLLAAGFVFALAFTLASCEDKGSKDAKISESKEAAAAAAKAEAEKQAAAEAEAAAKAAADSVAAVEAANTLTDARDGKKYRKVTIGDQTWMAENLNYEMKGSLCYNKEESNCQKYGRLYNWSVAKSACPQGWHLPSDDEWTKLTKFAGGASTAGKKLKATSGWQKKGNGTDDYGFSALPGGYSNNGTIGFMAIDINGYWWTSKEEIYEQAFTRNMGSESADVFRSYDRRSALRSVRCVQD